MGSSKGFGNEVILFYKDAPRFALYWTIDVDYLRRMIRYFFRKLKKIKNSCKKIIAYPFGLRTFGAVDIAWSTSIDGGGGLIKIGNSTTVDIGVVLRAYGGGITIGNDCSVNPYCVLYGGGGLTIGDRVRIAAHTVIVPSNHVFSNADLSIKDQGLSCEGITIEDDVWIGAGVRILDGVRVGKGSVVGAGAVVTKSIAPYSIVAGVPAKVIGSRR